jgi:ribose transport system substrate-binding protein
MRKLYLPVLAAVAAVIGVCACVGSAAGAAMTPSQAAKVLAAARKPITKFPGPTTSPGPIPKGKKLALVNVLPSPFPNNVAKGAKEAAKAVGWSVREFDAQGTPQSWSQAINSAINTKPDGIILDAMPAALLQTDIKKAKKAGIPVIAASPGMPSNVTPAQENLINVLQYVRAPVGRTLAAWVINKYPQGAEVLALTSPEFVDLQEISKAFVSTIKGAGKGFKVDQVIQSPVTDLGGGQTGITRLSSPMRAHPNAKAMFINSESWFSTFLKASKAAGNSKIQGLGSDGDVSIPLVQKGSPIAMMGSDSTTYGWYAVDSFIRYFNKKKQPTYDIPVRLVDSVNAKSIKTPGIRVSFDNAAAWKKLWDIK